MCPKWHTDRKEQTMGNTYREYIERVYTMNEDLIASTTNDIKAYNKELAEQRKKDREMVEWVWSSGVVTEWEMKHYNKDYQSEDTKKIIKHRAFNYRFRKSLQKHNEFYRQELARM